MYFRSGSRLEIPANEIMIAGRKGNSDAADSRGGMVREDVRRDINAMKVRVEEVFAAG